MMYSYYVFLVLLTGVYALFLLRMRSGLRALSVENAIATSGQAQEASQASRVEENHVPVRPSHPGESLSAGAVVDAVARMEGGGQDCPPVATRDTATPDTDSRVQYDLCVSIVVPVRNERGNVESLVQSMLSQDYPQALTEVLFIDDHSTDGTADELQRLTHDTPHFRVLCLPAAMAGKKDALSYAVQHAEHDIILTTDADCVHRPHWVAGMLSPFARDADVVAGPVVYADRDTLFARLQALEFLGLVGVGAGFFGVGYPRLCNGANFAYRKSAFIQAGGYSANRAIHSGDDEYLLRAIVYQHGGKAEFVTHPDAVVTAPPEATLAGFIRQRIRWVSKERRGGDPRFTAFLYLLFIFFVLHAALPVVVAIAPVTFPLAFAAFCSKILLDISVLSSSAALFRQPLRIPDILIAELVHPVYIVFVSVAGSIGVFTWKGRHLKNR
jgi:glycosyltransferase involved in cell wall biosynthesis